MSHGALSKNVKAECSKLKFLLILPYEYEAWHLTLTKEPKLRGRQSKVLRKMFVLETGSNKRLEKISQGGALFVLITK